MKTRIPVALVALLLLVARCSSTLFAADALQPSYQCLPDETVVVIRLPEALRFVEAFRSQTKLGNMLLSPQRFEGVVNLIREQAGEGLTEFTNGLAKYNLKMEDFPKLFEKEVGFAVVVEPRKDRYPLAVGLGWAEPESELGQRLISAIQQTADEDKDREWGARRVDFDIDGNQVMHLTVPMQGPAVLPGLDLDNVGELDGAQLRAKLEEQRKQAADAKHIEIDQAHMFFTRIGDRFLVGTTFPQNESEVRELLAEDPDKKIDLAAITGVEQAKGIFARFLKAHTAGASGLTPRVMATPGLAAALPDGVPLVEVLFSPDPLLKLAAASTDQTSARVLKALGLDRLGPGALRIVLDRGAMRTGLFLSAPEPRQGLLALLDQPGAVGEPPAWVPASVLSYGQFNLDLGKAFVLLRDLAISEGGDQVQQMITQVDQQMRGFLQTDIETLLSSVGQTHHFVSFPPTMAKVAGAGGVEAEVPSSRQGIVWQLKDEALWKRIIQLGGAFAAASGGIVTAGEEQGFVGLRFDVENTISGGLFVGHGYMVLGFGPDALEPLLSAVRTPPEGAAALRGGDLAKRAAALLPPEPAIYYQLNDFDRYVKSLRQTLLSLFDLSPSSFIPALGDAGNEDQPKADPETTKVIDQIKALFPTDQELEGTTGVNVGQLIVGPQGITYRDALELPPQ